MSIRTNPPQPTVSVKIIRYTSEAPFSVELRQRGAPSGWECHQTDTDKVTRKRRQLQTHQCFETNDRVHPTNGHIHIPYSFPQRGSVAFVGAESSAPRRTGRGGERSGQVLSPHHRRRLASKYALYDEQDTEAEKVDSTTAFMT